MRKILSLIRSVVKNSILHLRRNFWHSLAAVIVTALAMYSVSYFYAAAFRYREALQELRNRPQLTVFFKDETTVEEILNLKTSFELKDSVKEVNYVSKDEALLIYQQENNDKPELLEFVTADILPASLEISTTDIIYQEEIARELSNNPRVENVIFHSDVVQKLVQLSNSVQIEGIIWAGSLLVVSVLTIVFVVGMSIGSFGEEIEIMRLVGAGSWFIRWPFIIQGIFYGLLGSLISLGMLYTVPYIKVLVVGEANLALFPALGVFPIPEWMYLNLWLGTSILGSLLGGVASLGATMKYLKK